MARNTIYKGNTIDNFGRNLPVPYIDKIELYDVLEDDIEVAEETLGFGISAEIKISRIKIHMSLLVHTDEGFPVDEYIDELYKDLNLNIMLLTNKTYTGRLMQSKRNLKSVISSIFAPADASGWPEGTGTEAYILAGLDEDTIYTGTYNLDNQFKTYDMGSLLSASDLQFAAEYDENDNAILKSSNIIIEVYVPKIADAAEMAVFVGVSTAPPAEIYPFTDVLMAMSYGDFSAELIKDNKVLANKNRVGFFTKNGEFYPQKPMLAVNGNYFKTENFDVKQIKDSLDNLQASYSSTAQSDVELKTIMGNVDFIYTKYGVTPEYLVHLNSFRKNMKNQDVSTAAGRYYESYRILVHNANSALMNDNEQVFKRITYSSKLRDHRPSQWLPLLGATYNSSLEDNDFLYEIMLQTNLSKYVAARSDTGALEIDPLFTPEAPYNSDEMYADYHEAIKAKLRRFSKNFTTHTTTNTGTTLSGFYNSLGDDWAVSMGGYEGSRKLGMDNISVWLNDDKPALLQTALYGFEGAYDLFLDWALAGSGGDRAARRIYLGGYGSATGFDNSELIEHLETEYGHDWEEILEENDLSRTAMAAEHNHHAYESAKILFGYHGNPEHCTLEFGHDTVAGPPDAAGNYTCTPLFQTYLNLNVDDEEVSGVDRKTVDFGSSRYTPYKCFNQLRPFINVIGYGSEDNEDWKDDHITTETETGDWSSAGGAPAEWETEGYDRKPWHSYSKFGKFLRLRDHTTDSGYDWTLRGSTWFRGQIEDMLMSDPWLNPTASTTAAGSLVGALEASVGLAYTLYLNHESSFFLNLLSNEEAWNNLVSSESLLNAEGAVRTQKLNDYANSFANNIEDMLYGLMDDFIYNDPNNKTYRLRWCPRLSTTNHYDSNCNNENPYGGLWKYLITPREKRDPNGDPFTVDHDGDGTPDADITYYTHGGCGLTTAGTRTTNGQFFKLNPSYSTDASAEAFVGYSNAGRYVFNAGNTLANIFKNVWEKVWKPDVVDAVKDIVPLLAEYHGLNMSSGLHDMMAYIDIVTEKYGYFFFDMEKYIMQQSTISQYLNPAAFEKFFGFGRDLLNMTIKLDEVVLKRWTGYTDPSTGDSFTAGYHLGIPERGPNVKLTLDKNSALLGTPTEDLSLKFEGSTGPGALSLPYPYIPQLDVTGWTDLAVGTAAATEGEVVDMGTQGTSAMKLGKSHKQWAYLMQRNYDFAGTDAVPNEYRMACFAYNYYIDDDAAMAGPDAYKIKVKVRDKSDLIMFKLNDIATSINSDFIEYSLAAAENCAYDKFNSQFNQFFIDKMDEQWGNNMENAPWIRLSAAIPILEDLIYGRYGGELSVVFEAAQYISDSVNPYSGSLELLLYYKERFTGLLSEIATIEAQIRDDHYVSIGGATPTRKGTSEHRVFVIGQSASGPQGQNPLIVNKGIIDYAANRTDEFPVPPNDSVSQPPFET
jgi:hypothetical protein